MSQVRLFFINNWIRLVVTFVLGLGIMTIYNFTAGSWTELISYADGSFIAGFTWVAIGVLFIVELLGGLDIFVYLPRRKKKEDGRHEDFYEYSERRKQERKIGQFGFIAYLLQGLVFILFSSIVILVLRIS